MPDFYSTPLCESAAKPVLFPLLPAASSWICPPSLSLWIQTVRHNKVRLQLAPYRLDSLKFVSKNDLKRSPTYEPGQSVSKNAPKRSPGSRIYTSNFIQLFR